MTKTYKVKGTKGRVSSTIKVGTKTTAVKGAAQLRKKGFVTTFKKTKRKNLPYSIYIKRRK